MGVYIPPAGHFTQDSDAACAFELEVRDGSYLLYLHKYFPKKFKHTQPLQGQSLEAWDFVISRNTWLDWEHFVDLLEISVLLNPLFSWRVKKGQFPLASGRIWKTWVSWQPSAKIFPSPQQQHLQMSASFLCPRENEHTDNDNIPVSTFYSSASVKSITTNSKMLSSENECSIHGYLQQEEDPTPTLFCFCLVSVHQSISYCRCASREKERETVGKCFTVRKPVVDARILTGTEFNARAELHTRT